MHQIPYDLLLCVRAAEEGGFCQLEEKLVFHRSVVRFATLVYDVKIVWG